MDALAVRDRAWRLPDNEHAGLARSGRDGTRFDEEARFLAGPAGGDALHQGC
jgi:hypothetical protein